MTTQKDTFSPLGEAVAIEAARYALLRRLAFAIRHEMMAHVQPITMTGELLERRLRAPEPDLEAVREGVSRIRGFSHAAAQSCLDVISWFAPEPGRAVPLHEVVADTMALLGSSFGFRGMVLRDEVGQAPWPVPRHGLRQVLSASLLLLADDAGPPADITITAQLEGSHVRLLLTLEPTEGDPGASTQPPYRPLGQVEVAALAQAEGIGFSQQGDVIALQVHQAGA